MKESNISKLINKYLKENGINLNAFCRRCGVSKYIVERMMNGYVNVSIYHVIQVASLLNVDTQTLLKDCF